MKKQKIKIIFENKFFIAANKPSATLSVPTRLGEHEKRPILKFLLEEQLKIQLWATHRLDYEVSGLILYAKTADAHRAANIWFEKHLIHKTYSALTEGDAKDAEAFSNLTEWRCYLVRGKKRAFEAPYGQEAITLAKFVGVSAPSNKNPANNSPANNTETPALQWELHPKTGRGHQLRYELSKRKFPIVGDTLYGAKTENPDESIALTAITIDFSKCPEREKFELPAKIELPLT
jgi:tRNA pseudouridine32 synthase/23S rRNA pseudouridine746 synthase